MNNTHDVYKPMCIYIYREREKHSHQAIGGLNIQHV